VEICPILNRAAESLYTKAEHIARGIISAGYRHGFGILPEMAFLCHAIAFPVFYIALCARMDFPPGYLNG